MPRQTTLAIIIVAALGAGFAARHALDVNAARAEDAKPPTPSGKVVEDTQAKIHSFERKLSIARTKLEQAVTDAARGEVDDQNARELARMELDLAVAKLEQFQKSDAPKRIAEAELALQGARDSALEAEEELKQIEIMYEKQDLEDLTAEFVIQRGKRNAQRRQRQLELGQRALESLKEHEIPRERATLELEVSRKKAASEKAQRDAQASKLQRALVRMTAEMEIADINDQLARLKEDLKKSKEEQPAPQTEAKEL